MLCQRAGEFRRAGQASGTLLDILEDLQIYHTFDDTKKISMDLAQFRQAQIETCEHRQSRES